MKMRKRIFNTGSNLPKARINDWFELQVNRNRLVKQPVMRQSRRDGTVIYGAHAVNRLVGPRFSRHTYDYDIYSHRPLRHARQLERSIDIGTNSDLSYVERTSYPSGSIDKELYRVKIRGNESVEADYNRIPQGIKIVKRDGVRFESLSDAKSKYRWMNRNPAVSNRTGYGELHRIEMYEQSKKRKIFRGRKI